MGPGLRAGTLARALQLALAALQLLNLLGNVGLFLRSDPSIRGVMLAGRGLGQGWAYCHQCQSPGAAAQRALPCLPRLRPAPGPPLPPAGPLRGLPQLPALPVPAAPRRGRPAPRLRAAGPRAGSPAARPGAPAHGRAPAAALAHAAHRWGAPCGGRWDLRPRGAASVGCGRWGEPGCPGQEIQCPKTSAHGLQKGCVGGLAPSHGGLSHRLQHQHPVWALVQVPAAPLLIQLPANAPGKAAEAGLSAWAPAFA
uniref:Uncharacterized protein n=1 Tax=Oryctolagus cuniculus TaxID=9986 RepID=G1SD06_RABIT